MDLSKVFDFDKTKFEELFKIPHERLLEIGELITPALVNSASKERNTLEAAVDFFYDLKDKNLSDNELLYISFIAGAGYVTIIQKSKDYAKSI